VSRYPRDPRAYSASFQLGKVQRGRGLHAAAAQAFASCVRRAPKGALAEDARAEAAASFSAAGQDDKARKAAEAYLAQYPAGTHAERMRQLLKPRE
jgi:TolA-binding protein